MSNVHDAYRPPVGQRVVSRFWIRLAFMSVLLLFTASVLLVVAWRLQHQALLRDANLNRRPVIERYGDLRPDGSGVTESAPAALEEIHGHN